MDPNGFREHPVLMAVAHARSGLSACLHQGYGSGRVHSKLLLFHHEKYIFTAQNFLLELSSKRVLNICLCVKGWRTLCATDPNGFRERRSACVGLALQADGPVCLPASV